MSSSQVIKFTGEVLRRLPHLCRDNAASKISCSAHLAYLPTSPKKLHGDPCLAINTSPVFFLHRHALKQVRIGCPACMLFKTLTRVQPSEHHIRSVSSGNAYDAGLNNAAPNSYKATTTRCRNITKEKTATRSFQYRDQCTAQISILWSRMWSSARLFAILFELPIRHGR